MADLLAKWLNEEIKLSKKITDFERDFSSGYLFGELLHRFNQLDNFQQFSQQENISSKVSNFEKLEPTLRNLNIKFDSTQVDKIMKGERGHALRMLYQMKMILEKVYPPTDIAILRKTGKLGDNQPALKIGSQKAAYNKMQSDFFKTRLEALNKPQKTMNIEKHLQKFNDEAMRQSEEAKRFTNTQKEESERVKQEIRRAQINKLQRNAGFMEEWLAKGVEDWKQNMAYKKEREQSQLEFEFKQAQRFNQATMKKVEDAEKEVQDGIDQFEQTLMKNGINPRVTSDDAERALNQTASLNGSAAKAASLRSNKLTTSITNRNTVLLSGGMTKTGGVTLASVGLRSKAKKPLDGKARKERERRRMRMIADQMTHLKDIETKRREDEVLERMKRLSKQEEELAYESWRTQQCKQVIVENRKLREAKYDKRQELDTQNAIFKEKQMLDSMLEQMNREIDTLKLRDIYMRQKDKEAKKLRQTEAARSMVDAIFEIADQAYNHMQTNDSSEIDPRNWHEWQQLFIEGADISLLSQNNDANETAANTNVDFMELVDYLENKGQWPTTLVSENKPDLEQILGGPADNAHAGGKGKAPAKAPHNESVHLEDADTQISDRPENNFLVGDAVEQIINLNYPARGKQLRPKNPHYLNLKLCFIGYAFAGKKLQAMKLKDEYGLDSITLNDLVEEALKFYQENPNPIVKEKALEQSPIQESVHEDSKEESKIVVEVEGEQVAEAQAKDGSNSQPGTNRDAQDDKPPEIDLHSVLKPNPMFEKDQDKSNEEVTDIVSEASEISEELNPEEDFRKCGEQIQNHLFEGQEIPDQLYVDLFIAKLRMTYEYKDRDTLKKEISQQAAREIELRQKLEDLETELDNIRNPPADAPETKSKKKKKRTEEVVQQDIAKCNADLQRIQSVENNGWILIDFPSNFSQAMLLEKALSGYQMPEDLEPTQREIESEQAQLLAKPTEKPQPPKTLIPSGLDAVIWFDCKREECLRRALGRRIDSISNVIYHIEDNPPSIEKSPLCEIIEPIDDESESMASLVDRWVAFDQTKSGLEKWLTQFGDQINGRNLLARVEASGDINTVYDQIDSVLKQIVAAKEVQQRELRSSAQTEMLEKDSKEQDSALQEQEAPKQENELQQPEASQPPSTRRSGANEASKDDLSMFHSEDNFERDNIESEFKGVLMTLWKQTSDNYKSQMIKVLKKQRVQREKIHEYLYQIQIQFLQYLKRLDNKQQVLDKFVAEFNEFSDKYPDLREDDQTKEELHQRVDILSDELWEITEERKDQNVAERKKIMESGQVELNQEYLTACSQSMMQSEIDKFKGTVQLIHDYYHAIEEKVVPELPDSIHIDLGKDEGEGAEVEKIADGADHYDINSYSYPRLEELFKKALKAQQVPDVSAHSQSTVDKKAPPAKKDPKKGGAKGPETDEPKPESVYVKEMKEAIKVEKSILRFRLTQIKNWTLKRLRLQREQAITVFKKLDDWIAVSNKAENDAIEEVCEVIKEAIEDQVKIQDELRISHMDFFLDQGVKNYIDPPPEKLQAMEQRIHNRFTVPQLESIVGELKALSDESGHIANRQVVDLFVSKLRNTSSFADQGGVPQSWQSLSQMDFEKMVRNLDCQCQGSVDAQHLGVFLILLNSPLPTKQLCEQLRAKLNSNPNKFLEIDFWFEKSEAQEDREYSHPFPRVQKIKQILAGLFTADGQLQAEQAVSTLELSQIKKPAAAKTYSDVLFAAL